jgi:hypothetical protein
MFNGSGEGVSAVFIHRRLLLGCAESGGGAPLGPRPRPATRLK